MEFVVKNYKKKWGSNTRETVHGFTLHQIAQAELVVANPDKPGRPTNSPLYCYQIEPGALQRIRTFSTAEWYTALSRYLANFHTLA